jgi:hypothetical protein
MVEKVVGGGGPGVWQRSRRRSDLPTEAGEGARRGRRRRSAGPQGGGGGGDLGGSEGWTTGLPRQRGCEGGGVIEVRRGWWRFAGSVAGVLDVADC